MLLPDIDYDAHPVYARLAGRDPELDRETLLREHALTRDGLMRRLAPLRDMWPYPRPARREGAAAALADAGLIEARLPDPAVARLEEVAGPYFAALDMTDAVGGVGAIRLTPADLGRADHGALRGLAHELVRSGGLGGLAASYFGAAEIAVTAVHLKQSDSEQLGRIRDVFADVGVGNPDTVGMHIDTSCFNVKAIIYLSDVSSRDDGPFNYVLGSNAGPVLELDDYVVRQATQKLVGSARPEGRRKLMALPRAYRRRSSFGDDLPNDHPDARILLERERTCLGPRGTMVMFDPRGVHRGGDVRVGTRRVMQLELAPVFRR